MHQASDRSEKPFVALNRAALPAELIEPMPFDLQANFLRVFEERSVERLGTNKPITVDIRFVAATKDDLEAASKEKCFRADLFYRLNVVSLSIPPLRERKEDIPELFFHLCRLARARYRKEIPEISQSLIAKLRAKEWPGNIRELRNYADRLVLGFGNRSRRDACGTKETT
jgi:two-component system C4-dicarboxylate transport response regulator DctD